MTTTQNVDYATIVSCIDKLGIRIFDFVNHLTKEKRIGGGIIMDVYEGHLTADGKEQFRIALKEPRKIITSRTRDKVINEILDDIRQEIRIMKHLEAHPYIIDLYSVAFEDLKPILVVEYAVSTLPDHLAERKEDNNPVDWPNKSRICSEIADGLHALHQVNIVHGDIKGDNILLFEDENDQEKLIAKISDFGLSSTKASIDKGNSTGMTPAFCAPECTKNAPADSKHFENKPSKDNYSYGLLVWQIAKDGDEPFLGMDSEEIDELKHSDKELNILTTQLDNDTPEEFRIIITGMTRYNPYDRLSFVDVRPIMSSNDDTRYMEAKAAFETVLELPRDFGIPAFNSIQLMALSTSIKSKIFRSYQGAASNGDTEAICFLSKCCSSGFGIEMDKREIILLAVKAAEYGNLEAIKLIASYYDIYSDLKEYATLLFPWLLKAAEAGHQLSIWNVKLCYDMGIGVEENREKYFEWDAKEKLFDNLTYIDTTENFELGHSSLHRAAHEDDVNAKDNNGYTPLHLAAENGHIDIIKFLVTEFGADVNAKKNDGWTPLHLTVEEEDIDIIKFLVIELGADVNAKDNNGCTPLHVAIFNGYVDSAKLVVELGADLKAKDIDDWTVLHVAAYGGHMNILELLVIEFSVDVNAKDKFNQTMLHLAAFQGHADVVKLLVVEFGIDANAKNIYDQTALHHAAFKGHIDIVKLLVVEFGIDANAKDIYGRTSLHFAAERGHIDVVKQLVVEFGADANVKDNYSRIPLHFAAYAGCIEIIQLLVAEWRADINAIDSKGQGLLIFGIGGGHTEVVMTLLNQFHMDVNEKDKNGQTLLHLAVKFRQEKIIKMLVKKFKFNIHAKDIDGNTPLDLVNEPPVHFGVICDGCREYPIVGKRHNCQTCPNSSYLDFNFCSVCISTVEHNHKHIFKVIELLIVNDLLISEV